MLTVDRLLSECRNQGLPLSEGKMHYCLISSNRGSFGNDLLLLFRQGDSRPSLIAKIARTKQNNQSLANECRWLQSLHEKGVGLGMVPRTFLNGVWQDRTYFIQEMVSGVGLNEHLRNWRHKGQKLSPVLHQAVDFSVDLYKSRGQLLFGKSHKAESLFQQHLQLLDANPQQIRRIKAAAETVELVACFCHGDYWATNLLIEPKRQQLKAVIDYEFASNVCYTFFDLVWFIINLPLFVEPLSAGNMTNVYRETFFKSCGRHHSYRNLANSYFQKIGRSTPPLIDLFILGLLYGSFREQQLFGRSMVVDRCCQELLLHTINCEAHFAL